MASPLSFQGLSSGLQTDSIVNAILQQEGLPVQRLQARQTLNTKRITALQSFKTSLSALSTSLGTLGSTSFDARKVTSSDTNNAYVTATASGAVAGNFDLNVSTVATKGRISPTLSGGVPTNLAVADPLGTAIFSGSSATFAVKGTDGVIKTLTLGAASNSLNGLRDALNASGAGIVASVINTGSGADPYQLVVTAKDTGTGTTGGLVTLADVTSGGPVNSLGIAAGTVDSLTTPTTLTGGLQSAAADVAKDAVFTVNGIQLTRKTNVISDAVDGVTFTLKQGGQVGTTNLNVALDKDSITSAMQDVVSKFNAALKVYKDASVAGGPLANDPTARSFLSQIRSALGGVPSGLPDSATFTNAAGLGLKTNRDGTLSLDTTAFQAALDKDPDAAKRVFAFSGTSDNAALKFYSASDKTAIGPVAFNITSYVPNGAVTANFTLADGSTYSLSGSSGNLLGGVGTPLEGLVLIASGTGSGTMTLSRGVGAAVRDLVTNLTATGTGQISQVIQSVSDQNNTLAQRITVGQARLDARRTVLTAQFAQMEATIGQLQSASSSLTGLA